MASLTEHVPSRSFLRTIWTAHSLRLQTELMCESLVLKGSGTVTLISLENAPGFVTRGRYHGGRRPSSDDSFHSPTVIPPAALDKLRIMKHYHRRRTCSHTSPRYSPMMVTLHDTQFVECRWWNDDWTVKTVVT